MRCITHFHACDCREEKFRLLEKENTRLQAVNIAQVKLARKLQEKIKGLTEALVGISRGWCPYGCDGIAKETLMDCDKEHKSL